MFEEMIYVFAGFLSGTVAGLLPGIGVLTSLTILFPFLQSASPLELILFYMALAATVQYVGTVPAIFVGIPGETNSAPAVQEGTKFARHKNADIAVGVCAIGSVFGALIAIGMFYLISGFILETFGTVVSNRFKSFLYLSIILGFMFFFNHRKVLLNLLFIGIGIFLGMIGENPIEYEFRFTFGIDDLRWGLDLLPMIAGLVVVPALVRKGNNYTVEMRHIDVSFRRPFFAFLRNWTSSLRGSMIGFLCGLIPGVTTSFATAMSHTVESRLHPNKPMRKITGAETSNNSAQFASLLPLLLFGIPVTGSEVFLYQLLIDAGWAPSQLNNIPANIKNMISNVLPWFIVVNVLGLAISWPLAKHAMILYKIEYKYIVILVLTTILFVLLYTGYEQNRMISYILQALFAGAIGFAFSKYNLLPMFTAYILSNNIESVLIREIMFFKIYLGV
jgi:putative tricarboxylic transport membrane protein